MIPPYIWCAFLAICDDTQSPDATKSSRFYPPESVPSSPQTSSLTTTSLPLLARSIYTSQEWPALTTTYPGAPTVFEPNVGPSAHQMSTTYIVSDVKITLPSIFPASASDLGENGILGQETDTEAPVPLITVTGIAWEVVSGTTEWIINGMSAPQGWWPSPVEVTAQTKQPGEAGVLAVSSGQELSSINWTSVEDWSVAFTLTSDGDVTTIWGESVIPNPVTILGETVTSTSMTDTTAGGGAGAEGTTITGISGGGIVYTTVSTKIIVTIDISTGTEQVATTPVSESSGSAYTMATATDSAKGSTTMKVPTGGQQGTTVTITGSGSGDAGTATPDGGQHEGVTVTIKSIPMASYGRRERSPEEGFLIFLLLILLILAWIALSVVWCVGWMLWWYTWWLFGRRWWALKWGLWHDLDAWEWLAVIVIGWMIGA